jgi:phenylpropionate dioxygenase-like ring-hydroxylating dioxygenase large terminal subunit
MYTPNAHLRPGPRTASLNLPAGWYLLALSTELQPRVVTTRKLGGEDVVLYRTQSGVAVAVAPWCPHLGAHLGHGGTVVGEHLRCPFHGFCFDTSGACTSTPYDGQRPPRVRAGTYPLLEQNGFILIWFDPAGRAPWFTVPAFDMEGWPPFRTWRTRLCSHPQEISENAVDVGHFSYLHGYENVRLTEPVTTNGAVLTTSYALERNADLFGRPGNNIKTGFTVNLFGVGYNQIVSHAANFGLHTRIVVLQTPSEDGHIELTLAISVRLEDRRKLHPILMLIPDSWAHSLVQRAAMLGFRRDVSQDLVMWQNKQFLPAPGIAPGDGPIDGYRNWCRQFYAPQAEHGSVPDDSQLATPAE